MTGVIISFELPIVLLERAKLFLQHQNRAVGIILLYSALWMGGSCAETQGRPKQLAPASAESIAPPEAKTIQAAAATANTALYRYKTIWLIAAGIDHYADSSIPPLEYAESDARDFENIVRKRFAARTKLLLGTAATKANILEAVRELKQADKDDCVIFYFSGHGQTVTLPAGGEMGFLIPQDAKIAFDGEPAPFDYDQTCIPMKMVRDWQVMCKARHFFVIADACFSGFLTSHKSSPVPRPIQDAFRFSAFEVLTAGTKGQKAFELSDKGHGIFTYHLLRGIETGAADLNNDGFLRGSELGQYIRDQPIEGETPQFRIMDGDGDIVLPLALGNPGAPLESSATPQTAAQLRNPPQVSPSAAPTPGPQSGKNSDDGSANWNPRAPAPGKHLLFLDWSRWEARGCPRLTDTQAADLRKELTGRMAEFEDFEVREVPEAKAREMAKASPDAVHINSGDLWIEPSLVPSHLKVRVFHSGNGLQTKALSFQIEKPLFFGKEVSPVVCVKVVEGIKEQCCKK